MNFVSHFIVAGIATLAIAILFNASKKDLLFCAFTGAIGWIIYYIMNQLGLGVVLPSAVATFFLTVFSRIFAVLRKKPATVYLLVGIFPLVPGAGIFYTAYYTFLHNSAAYSKAVETFEIAGAIVLGIILGFAIPNKLLNRLSPSAKANIARD